MRLATEETNRHQLEEGETVVIQDDKPTLANVTGITIQRSRIGYRGDRLTSAEEKEKRIIVEL